MSTSGPTRVPALTFWLHTCQSRSRIWCRPCPVASDECVKNSGLPDTRWMSSWAVWSTFPTSFGMTNVSSTFARVGVEEGVAEAGADDTLTGCVAGDVGTTERAFAAPPMLAQPEARATARAVAASTPDDLRFTA